ncbi:Pre-mRNA-splicing factor SYF2 [Exophiala xenobiotica]|uniref:Pre-mRNA-splicing factor SYF2 n=1 Tax=Lithohypha guttulata TaxID=1690604 RepID=A0ABR0K735_9EURO|nr:Pre-mRNA-splicing factor SYF2 [Lithohypha guttulata]KAK5318763.1 Pre-mRNA-splicing factor SYF2 [Exophiala xenobiotica]
MPEAHSFGKTAPGVCYLSTMSPPAKKRRLSPPGDAGTVSVTTSSTIVKDQPSNEPIPREETAALTAADIPSPVASVDSSTSEDNASEQLRAPSTTASTDRLARFAALKKRATQSARSNLSEAKAEAQRGAIDHTALANLSRRSAIAQHNLLKADTEENEGTGAFERKRAWDYTIEESERWDERMARKKEAREKNSFQDYGAEAAKIYDRQIRELEKTAQKDGGRNRDEYLRQKAELIEQAARSGGLEIVEMDNGELVAIDRDGRFYADQNNTGFVEQKPRKENVDRLVEDIRKAEEVRLKKRKERRGDTDEGDVTYINEKNKQFNLKLARFYDRYTSDIRESFERGTAI